MIQRVLRAVFQRLPLSAEAKLRTKGHLFETFPGLFRGWPAYQVWQSLQRVNGAQLQLAPATQNRSAANASGEAGDEAAAGETGDAAAGARDQAGVRTDGGGAVGYRRAWNELNAPIPELSTEHGPPLTRVMYLVWMARDDVQQAFDLTRLSRRSAFADWFRERAPVELGLPAQLLPGGDGGDLAAPRRQWAWLRGLRARRSRGSGGPDLERLPAPSPHISREAVPEPELPPRGVNLVGYARGVLGLGEDVRTAGLAMDAAGVRFGVYNFTRNLFTAQIDGSADRWLTDRLDYRANLFCMPGQQAPTAFMALGPEAFDGRYNIGYWAWELPAWPEAWRHAFWFVDEVWAPSTYTQQALAAHAPVPVRRMPLAVTVEPPGRASRADFGLPDGAFLFLFAFDVHSQWARKNPWAVIEAFGRAFPRGDEPVGLVLKVINARTASPEWRRFQEAAAADPRIRLISRTLERGEMHDLVDLCDAYVSLHRSEGFGRGPAEAMRLGKPVVVTNYSGNTDFTLPDTACLVDCELIPVGEDEYWGAAGQIWAEPDTAQAADWMRRLAAEPDWGAGIGARARRHMQQHHSPEAVGAHYRARLAELGLIWSRPARAPK